MKTLKSNCPASLSKYALFLLPMICALFLSCEVVPTAAAYHKYANEPRARSGSRSSTRSTRSRRNSSSRSDEEDDDDEVIERPRGRSSSIKNGSRTPWSKYMQIFDINRSHGSGIFVDLGGTETVNNKSYRMPVGKCPVVAKVINLGNGADFLNRINAKEPRDRGLAFPETADAAKKTVNTRPGVLENITVDGSLSPVSAAQLIKWGYTGNDVANCAEYASNIRPGSDANTKYRYPFVYDSKEEMCHILYSPMQYNQGARYCDNDGSARHGTSSLLCMRPIKSDIDAHLYYGSANVDPKWEQNCPMYPVKDAIFGKWANGSCVAIEPVFEDYTNGPEECSAIMFENSASDIQINESVENLNELETLREGISTVDLNKIYNSLFSPIVNSTATAKNSKGMGMNWANYDTNTGLCRVLDETPNCLVISAGSLAMTALGSPLEEDAVKFPCDIVTNGYIEPHPRSHPRNGNPPFEVTTALSRKALKCSKYVHEKYSESCGTYYYCSEDEPSLMDRLMQRWNLKRIAKYVLTGLAIIALIMAIYWAYRHLWATKMNPEPDEYERLMSKYEYDEGSSTKSRMDQQLKSDAYIWGEAAARPSEVTPVHLSKVE